MGAGTSAAVFKCLTHVTFLDDLSISYMQFENFQTKFNYEPHLLTPAPTRPGLLGQPRGGVAGGGGQRVQELCIESKSNPRSRRGGGWTPHKPCTPSLYRNLGGLSGPAAAHSEGGGAPDHPPPTCQAAWCLGTPTPTCDTVSCMTAKPNPNPKKPHLP